MTFILSEAILVLANVVAGLSYMLKTLSPSPVDEIIQRLSSLKAEVGELDAIISSVVLRQAEKISEIESWVDPFSNGGDAICNFFEVNYDD